MPETIISFRGVDAGVSDIMQKLRQDSLEYGREMVSEAQSRAQSSKEVIDYLNKEISALERKNQLNKEIREADLKAQRREELGGVRGDLDAQKEIKSGYEDKFQQLNEESNLEALQVKLLRELIDVIKEDPTRYSPTAAGTAIDENGNPILIPAGGGGAGGGGRNGRGRAGGAGADGKQDQETKPREGESMISMFGKTLGFAAVVAILGSTIKALDSITSSSRNSSEAEAKLWGMIPIFGGGMEARQLRHLQEWEAQGVGAGALRGVTGRSAIGGGSPFGLAESEMTPIGAQIARSRGFTGNIAAETQLMVGAGKAYGIDQSAMMGIMATGGIGVGGFAKALAEFTRGLEKEGGDRARAGLGVSQMGTIAQVLSQSINQITPELLAQIVSTFQGVGGPWGDVRGAGLISGLHGGLQGGANEFQKAMEYRVLSKLNPGASWNTIADLREGGISTPGYLEGMFNQFRETGGDQQGLEQAKTFFEGKISRNQMNTLWAAFKKNPNLFKGIGAKGMSEGDRMDQLNKIMGMGAENVPSTMKEAAEVKNAFAVSGEAGQALITAKIREDMKAGVAEWVDNMKALNKTTNELVDSLVKNGSYLEAAMFKIDQVVHLGLPHVPFMP